MYNSNKAELSPVVSRVPVYHAAWPAFFPTFALVFDFLLPLRLTRRIQFHCVLDCQVSFLTVSLGLILYSQNMSFNKITNRVIKVVFYSPLHTFRDFSVTSRTTNFETNYFFEVLDP